MREGLGDSPGGNFIGGEILRGGKGCPGGIFRGDCPRGKSLEANCTRGNYMESIDRWAAIQG